MRFVYSAESIFTTQTLLLDLYYPTDIEPDYSNLRKELEMRTIERAIELGIERGLVSGSVADAQHSQDKILKVLKGDSSGPAFLMVPLDTLAAVAAIFERTYRYNQYAAATRSAMVELGAETVYFASEDGNRIPLRPLNDDNEDLQDIVQIVKSLAKIDAKFDRRQCEEDLFNLIQDYLEDPEEPQRTPVEDLASSDWLITLNEAANEVAVDLIKSLQVGN